MTSRLEKRENFDSTRIRNNRFKKKLLSIVIYTIILSSCLFYSTFFIMDPKPSHNTVTNMAMSAAPLKGLGSPYKDYWDIYPPGIYIIWTILEFLFHGKTFYLKVLHIILVYAIGFLTYTSLKTIFKNIKFRLFFEFFFFTLYIFLSNYFFCILLHNALFGIFFSSLGLYTLTNTKSTYKRYFLSSFFFSFAGSIKETFFFLFLLPFVEIILDVIVNGPDNYIIFIKRFILICFGTVFTILINYLYLFLLNIYQDYQAVLLYKSSLVPNHSILDIVKMVCIIRPEYFGLAFSKLTYSFLGINLYYLYFIFFIPFFIEVLFLKKKSLNKKHNIIYYTYFYLNFIGFRLLNRWSPNYTMQMVIPFVMIVASLLSSTYVFFEYLTYSLKKTVTILKELITYIFICAITFLIIASLMHSMTFYRFLSPKKYISGFIQQENKAKLPDSVKEVLEKDNRVLFVYGWGTPYFYYYNEIKPYSKYFILHPSILSSDQMNEFAKQFTRELPKVIVYDTISGPDMDVDTFERKYIKLKLLLEKCYILDDGYYILSDSSFFYNNLGLFIPNNEDN